MTDKRDVDQGYAWVVLLGACLVYTLVQSSIKAYGIVYSEFLQQYRAGSGNTAWIGSTVMLLMFAMGPFANFFSRKYSFRAVVFLGGLLIGTGYIATGFIPRLEYMYVTLGTVAGLGYGLVFTPCATIISFYFEKRRTLANGIVVGGGGIGTVLFPPLYRFLIDTYGLQWTLILIGGITLNVCVGACSFRQPSIFVKPKKVGGASTKAGRTMDSTALMERTNDGYCDVIGSKSIEEDNKASACCDSGPNFKLKLLKQIRFTITVLSLMCCVNGYSIILLLLPVHIKSLEYGDDKAALSLSVLGACEFFARPFMGWFADRNIVRKKYLFIICMFVSSAFACITPSIQHINYLIVYAGITGIFPGSFWSLVAVLLIDVVGLGHFTEAFGLLTFAMGLCIFIIQPIAGWLNDLTGNWKASFYLASAALFLSGILLLTEPTFRRFCGQATMNEYEYDIVMKKNETEPNEGSKSLEEESKVITHLRTSQCLLATIQHTQTNTTLCKAPIISLENV